MSALPRSAFPMARIHEDAIQALAAEIRARRSAQLLGPSNSGKSMVLRSLTTEDMRGRLAPRGAAPPLVVFVDCLDLYAPHEALTPAWDYWPRQLTLIADALEAAGEDGDAIGWIRKAKDALAERRGPATSGRLDPREFWLRVVHETLRSAHRLSGKAREDLDAAGLQQPVAGATSVAALHVAVERSMRSCMETMEQETGRAKREGIVLILDEFDDAFSTIGARNLRALRRLVNDLGRESRYLGIVVATCRRLEAYVERDGRVERDPVYEFREIFRGPPVRLDGLRAKELEALVEYQLAAGGEEIGQLGSERIMELSGGHLGLAMHLLDAPQIAKMADDEHEDGIDGLAAALLRRLRVRNECWRLWAELDRPQQVALAQWFQGTLDPSSGAADELVKHGVLAHDGSRLASRLLQAFLRQRFEMDELRSSQKGLRYNDEEAEFYVDGQLLVLEPRERDVLLTLFDRKDTWTPAEEILAAVWGDTSEATSNLVHRYIRKLRKEIETDPEDPTYIVTRPAYGYRLYPQGPEGQPASGLLRRLRQR